MLDHEIPLRPKGRCRSQATYDDPRHRNTTATTLAAFGSFSQDIQERRDFAAWLGLTPLRRSTGGKQKHGETVRRLNVAKIFNDIMKYSQIFTFNIAMIMRCRYGWQEC